MFAVKIRMSRAIISSKVLFTFLGFFLFHFSFAQTPRIDSLLRVLKTLKEDTTKANTLHELTRAYLFEINDNQKVGEYGSQQLALSLKLHFKKGIAYGYLNRAIYYRATGDLDTALIYDNKSLRLMQEIGDKKGEGSCNSNIGLTYSHKGDFNKALEYMFRGVKMKEEIHDKKGMASGYNNIGNVYLTQGDFTKALEYHLKSLQIREEMHDKLGTAMSYNNIGNVFNSQNNFKSSLDYYRKALKINEELNDYTGIGNACNNIGSMLVEKKQYKDARTYYFKALEANNKAGDKRGIATCYNNLGDVYLEEKKADESLNNQFKSYELYKKIDDKKGISEAASGIGRAYNLKNDFDNAHHYNSLALKMAAEINYIEGVRDAYQDFAALYKKANQFEKALNYTKLYYALKDSLSNKDNFKQVSELNTRYETDKKEREILLLTKDQELTTKIIKQQRFVRWGLIGGLILLFISIYSIFRRYRFKQSANLLLEHQKEEIQKKNRMITDSIDYARNIQESLFPSYQEIQAVFPRSFLLYKPKSIVSGDFYWVGRQGDELICVTADCTGHGVPGAFMSLLGYNILENAIKKNATIKPAAILEDLNLEIIKSFYKSEDDGTIKHGFDISFISINSITNRLQFAGAHNSLFIVRNSQLIELKADKKGIGFIDREGRHSFENQTFDLIKGDMIYLFTDGYPDQIGGPNRKKFYYRPFKELLVSIHNLPTDDQCNKLNDVHTQWLGKKMDQTDDILVMGILY